MTDNNTTANAAPQSPTPAAGTTAPAPANDGRSELEHMLAGELYNAADPQLEAMRNHGRELWTRFNALSPDATEEREAVLRELLGGCGERPGFLGPVFFDYGCHTIIGDDVFANFNFTVLDCNWVRIGSNTMFGPNVSIVPPIHPLRWQERNGRVAADGSRFDYEYGAPITIGANCWIAANVTICGGVTIGDGCVIGAGSVVTHDIPDNSLAVGTPARVLREITEADAMGLPTRVPEMPGQPR